MEPLHVLEQKSGMVKGEVSRGLPGLQDVMVNFGITSANKLQPIFFFIVGCL